MTEHNLKDQKPKFFGLAARYETEKELIAAARLVKSQGYENVETYSPFPVEGISEILGHKEFHIPWMVFGAGSTGCILGFLMQYAVHVWNDPLNIGGRPLNSWPAFIPIMFEMTILFAAITGFITFIRRCGLPEVYHPVFNIPNFERATLDNFFLCVMADDKKFKIEEVRAFFQKTNPQEVHLVEP